MPSPLPTRALLVTEQRLTVDALSLALGDPGGPLDRPVALTEVRTASEALARAQTGTFDVAFVDLASGGLDPMDALARCRAVGDLVPLVALAPDEAIGAQCVLSGAYDYVVPDALAPALVRRVIRAVLERRRLEHALHTLEHNDSLTGLLNRRGFSIAAEPRLRQAWRGKGVWLVLADVNGLRRINDRLGYSFGNEALLAVSAAIKASIRGSDLAARVGGDEFTLMLVDSAVAAASAVASRLERKLNQFADEHRVPVSLTLGTVRCEAKNVPNLDEMIRRADEELASEKGRNSRIGNRESKLTA
jgi:diguanylate cyclase (GGDEF)-like protein